MALEKRFDRSPLSAARWTPQGYARFDARLARVGVQTYRRADGSTRRELRHPDDVFAAESLAKITTSTPATVGHPGVFLDATNTRDYRVGHVSGRVRADGQYLAAELTIDDAAALARVDAGELVEISAGYTVDLDETPGEYLGQRYDARQKSITFNHVALLPAGAGRAGRDVKLRLDSDSAILVDMAVIRIDSKDFEVADAVHAAYLALTSKLADSEKALGTAEAKLVSAEKARADALDPKALDARVAERVALEGAARKVLGEKYSAAGKSARQVHEDALKSVRSDAADFAGLSDDRVLGQFEALTLDSESGRASAAAQFAAARASAAPGKDPNARDDSDDTLDPDAEYKASIARKAGKK